VRKIMRYKRFDIHRARYTSTRRPFGQFVDKLLPHARRLKRRRVLAWCHGQSGATRSRLDTRDGPAPPSGGDGMESADGRWEQHREKDHQKDCDGGQVGHGSLISPRCGIDLGVGQARNARR
jgi:hypothetical protein